MNHRTCLPTVLLLTALLYPARATAAGSCEDLSRLALSAARVLSAQRVVSRTFSPTGGSAGRGARQQAFAHLPTFCRVVVSSKPTIDSDIQIEVWLPESGWNGRLQAVGDGGLAGSIPYALMAPALSEGYATSGTDTGHVGSNADFMPAHPEKLVDFAYRSTHEMTVAGKAVVAAFYGQAPTWSYYNACCSCVTASIATGR